MKYRKFDESIGKIILGLGFDHQDCHKRITKGEEFLLLGGSEQTHDQMLEKVLAFRAMLSKYGKKLDELSRDEYYEIVRTIGEEEEFWHYHRRG